jgi:hypothetical protein
MVLMPELATTPGKVFDRCNAGAEPRRRAVE